MRGTLGIMLVACFLLACGGDDDNGLLPGPGGSTGVTQPTPDSGDVRDDVEGDVLEDADDAAGSSAPTLDEVHGAIFEDCVVCHSVEPPDLRLDDGLRSRLLGPSLQLPSMAFIVPGDRDASYLWHKVSGTHIDVGGMGSRMPSVGLLLDAEQMDLLRAWIDAGAPR